MTEALYWFDWTWPVAAWLVGAVALQVAGRRALSRLDSHPLPATLLRFGLRPAQWVLLCIALQISLHAAPDGMSRLAGARQFVGLLNILMLTWLAINLVRAAADYVIGRHPDDVPDNLQARRVRTQAKVLSRTLTGLVGVIGLSAGLMTFPEVRQFGASLLASAGVAGLVVGLAAKPVLGNLLAGLQIAMTQPIRLDDVVIVEGEWGRIEEIAGTYVAVRIWDDRRMIVPLQWFIEHPFQNWTRTGSALLGSVMLWVDYGTPLEGLREEARRICESAREWDGRVCVVQVVEADQRAMQVRVLVSAADSALAFDLRCKVREELIGWLRHTQPESLPLMRISAPSPGAGNDGRAEMAV